MAQYVALGSRTVEERVGAVVGLPEEAVEPVGADVVETLVADVADWDRDWRERCDGAEP